MTIRRTREYERNIDGINDDMLLLIITDRIKRLADGNAGDSKSLGNGISELRIHYGTGYRVYYTKRGKEIIILLCAGNKSNQKKNIEKAIKLAKEL